MKQWNSRVLAYRRLALSHLSRPAVLLLLLQILSEEGIGDLNFDVLKNRMII